MSKTFESIDEELSEFMDSQRMFFVGTAPRSDRGHVNVSPKGLPGTFAVIDPRTVAYLDLTGSGVETIAHLRENGRICLMFCAFEGPPRIVRIHGTGEVIEPGDDRFDDLSAHFERYVGARSIIRVRADRISDSCGFGVPRYEHIGDREQLTKWATTKGRDGIAEYQRERNQKSIDDLPSSLRASRPKD